MKLNKIEMLMNLNNRTLSTEIEYYQEIWIFFFNNFLKIHQHLSFIQLRVYVILLYYKHLKIFKISLKKNTFYTRK